MKYFKFLLLSLIFAFISIVPGRGQAAEKFNFAEKATWELRTDSSVNVTSTIDVSNLTDNYYATGFEFYLPAETLENLKANYSDGGAVKVAESEDKQTLNGLTYNYKKINLTFERQVLGRGNSFRVNMNYSMTGTFKQKGQTYELNLPSFSASNINKSIVIKAPKSLGNVHFLTDDPANSSQDASFNYYTYSNELLTGKQQMLVFGDQMSRQLNFSYPLENIDILPSFFKFYLPMDNDHQSVFVKSVEPKPFYEGKKSDGSNYLYFLLWPGQKVTVKANVQVLSQVQTANINKDGQFSEIPEDVKANLLSAKYWEVDDPIIRAQASELIKSTDSVFTNAERVYNFVVDKLSYNQAKIDDNVRQGALGVLGRPDYAVCQEYADLFVTLLRAGGIPAREYFGLTDSAELRSSEGNILHAWADVYIPGYGWLVADPTWGEAGLKFGKMAFDHLAVDFDSGEDFSRPIVLKNDRPYDYGLIYVGNVKMTENQQVASGDTLPAGNLTKERVLDSNRYYFFGLLIGILVVYTIIRIIVYSRRKKTNTV